MKKMLLAGIATFAFASAAQAATIMESGGLGFTSNPIATTVDVAAFNPALGTLTGVTITLTGQTRADLTLECFKDFTCTYNTVDAGSSLDITAPGVASAITLEPVGSPTVPLSISNSTPGVVDGNAFGPASTNLLEFTDLMGDDSVIVSPASFAAYDGVGESFVTFSVEGINATLIGATGPQQAGAIADSALDIGIEYTFDEAPTVIPLPASLPLLAFGLGLLAWRARKT